MDADFARKLAPFGEASGDIPFTHESIINRFAVFMWNMLFACESGSIGGDACRMNRVLLAALDDIECMPDHQMRIELCSV